MKCSILTRDWKPSKKHSEAVSLKTTEFFS
jgi:hypothetical protein